MLFDFYLNFISLKLVNIEIINMLVKVSDEKKI